MKKSIFITNIDPKYLNNNLWDKIQSLDLQLIVDRMIIKHGWSEEKAQAAVNGYKKYLYLTQIFEGSVSPTADQDFVWHEHILHTNKYAIDCNYLFNKFLHHLPTPSKWKLEKKEVNANCQSPCCNNNDCCNDNPSKISVTVKGNLTNADCGEPITGGCVNIGGSDDDCAGTTNDGFNFNNPDMSKMVQPMPYRSIASKIFIN